MKQDGLKEKSEKQRPGNVKAINYQGLTSKKGVCIAVFRICKSDEQPF
jgi:hypothetical protein